MGWCCWGLEGCGSPLLLLLLPQLRCKVVSTLFYNLPLLAAGEKELKEKRAGMGKGERAKMAAGKPLLRQSSKGCQLHLKVG